MTALIGIIMKIMKTASFLYMYTFVQGDKEQQNLKNPDPDPFETVQVHATHGFCGRANGYFGKDVSI